MKMKAILFVGALVFAVVAAIIYLTKKEQIGRYAKIPVNVSVVIPITGSLAYIGEQIKAGMDLALEETKANLIITYEDSQGKSKSGVNAVNKSLISDNPDFIVVNLTSVAMSSKGRISEEKDLKSIYLSTHPKILNDCTNCYRFFTSGKQEGDLLTTEIIKDKADKILLVYVNDAYGEGTINYIEEKLKNESQELTKQPYALSEINFSRDLLKAKNSGISNIVIIGYGFEYPQFFKSLTELDYFPNIYSNFSFANREGKEINYLGTIKYTTPTFDLSDHRTALAQEFYDKYQTKFNRTPDFNAAYGYDVIKILSAYFNSTSEFNDFLHSFDFNGAMGKYSFLEDGEVITEMKIISFNGKNE